MNYLKYKDYCHYTCKYRGGACVIRGKDVVYVIKGGAYVIYNIVYLKKFF